MYKRLLYYVGAHQCVRPYDFVKYCSEKSYADVFYRQKPACEAGFLLYGTFADDLCAVKLVHLFAEYCQIVEVFIGIFAFGD